VYSLLIFTVSSPIILSEAVDMGYMKRAEAQYAKERASIHPVLMQFTYDSTVKLWRVTFRPRGDNTLPRVIHFGDAEKLRDLFRRFGSRQTDGDVATLEFAIRSKRGKVELMLGEMQLRHLRKHKTPTLNTDHGVSKPVLSATR
jgi:hypothetical protein